MTFNAFLAIGGPGGPGGGDGITVEHLCRASRRCAVGLSEEEAAEMVREADRDCNGSVSIEEYTIIMKNTGWF